MLFAILTLLTALALATVAGWFSIVGFMTIYAGAPMYALVMGAVTEAAKLVTTSWLYRNWQYASWKLKLPLLYFTLALMTATSIGVFGFLSKAHIEQGADKIDNSARIESLQYRIDREKSVISDAEKVISQLDNAVAALNEAQRISGPRGSVAVRRSQEAERQELRKIIEDSQKRIDALNEEKFKLESEVRKLQLEVGPIRYISELIYGVEENSTKNIEAAVRIFTLLLVSTLDPLAVILLVAANHTLLRLKREEKEAKDKADTLDGPGGGGSAPIDQVNIEKVATIRDIHAEVKDTGEIDQRGDIEKTETPISEKIPQTPSKNIDEETKITKEGKDGIPFENVQKETFTEESNQELETREAILSTEGGSSTEVQKIQVTPYEEKVPVLEKSFIAAAGAAPPIIRSPKVTRVEQYAEVGPEEKNVQNTESPNSIKESKDVKLPWAQQETVLRELLGNSFPHFIPKKVNEEENSIKMEKNPPDKSGEESPVTQTTSGRNFSDGIKEIHSTTEEKIFKDTKEKKKVFKDGTFNLPQRTLSWINEFKGNRDER